MKFETIETVNKGKLLVHSVYVTCRNCFSIISNGYKVVGDGKIVNV